MSKAGINKPPLPASSTSLAQEIRSGSKKVFSSRIRIAVLILSTLLGACTTSTKLLPHSVYFRSGSGEDFQVWRLETDGVTKVQITDGEIGVVDFDVSPADGSLAIISSNQLFLLDNRGENRRLIADGTKVDQGIENYADRGFVESPVFSPDGRTLAFAFDGLHLYDLTSGQDEHVLTNLGNLLGEPFIFSKRTIFPIHGHLTAKSC